MKKLGAVFCCLAALLFLPSQLPAPGYPYFDLSKTCVMEGGEWYYQVVITNQTSLEISVMADEGMAEPVPIAPYATHVFTYGYSSSCPATSNTVTVTSKFVQYPTITWQNSDTAQCVCGGDGGCTLTWGYWKTHSFYGPAPYDSTWDLLDEDAMFFPKAGLSYYQVLWTDPGDSNPYFSLAHQYIAVLLNQLKGAEVPAGVAAAMASAQTLFETYSPGQVGGKNVSGAVKSAFRSLVPILTDFNEGSTGPGHCDKR